MDDRIMTDPRQRVRWFFWLRDVAPLVWQTFFFGWNEQGGIMASWKDLLARTIVNPSPAMRDVIDGTRMTPDGHYYDPSAHLTIAEREWVAMVRRNADIDRGGDEPTAEDLDAYLY